MNVLFLSPGFPNEMCFFSEGLANVGAKVYGVGEAPVGTLPARTREALTAYLQVPSLWDEEGTVEQVRHEIAAAGLRIDRVETLWEPLVVLAAKLREALGVPGMSVARVLPFRDKELMKRKVDEAGVRTPHHVGCRSQDEIREAAERVEYPLIVKPIAGAGSADTYRVDDAAQLEEIIAAVAHVEEVSVEEFIEGEEFTFDAICIEGHPVFVNLSLYRPRPLVQRTVQWVSPQTVALRDVHAPELASGYAMGLAVLKALDMGSGFTHMEWFRKPDGEAVFCEIGARVAGARSIDIMNFATDMDLFTGWAEAVCHGSFSQPVTRRHNAAIIFKRAEGEGRIQSIHGLSSVLSRFGSHVVSVDLLPIGAHRRNWKSTLLSDGHVILRHPDLATCLAMADAVGTDLRMGAA